MVEIMAKTVYNSNRLYKLGFAIVKRFLSAGALLLAAFIWGTTFVAQKSVAGGVVGPFTFNALRSFLGALVLLPLAIIFKKPPVEQSKAMLSKRIIGYGALCGVILFCACNLQQMGLSQTSAGKSGFITAMYVVLVPLVGYLAFRKRTGWNVWVAVVMAIVGLYLLCVKQDFSLERGDFLTLGCALVFCFHILVVDFATAYVSGLVLSFVQFIVCGCLSLVAAFLFEEPSLPAICANWMAWVYAGVLSSGVAYTLQIIGQARTEPAVASLLMSLESVLGALSGWLVLNERMSIKELIGCVIMFAAIVFAQFTFDHKTKEDVFCEN